MMLAGKRYRSPGTVDDGRKEIDRIQMDGARAWGCSMYHEFEVPFGK